MLVQQFFLIQMDLARTMCSGAQVKNRIPYIINSRRLLHFSADMMILSVVWATHRPHLL